MHGIFIIHNTRCSWNAGKPVLSSMSSFELLTLAWRIHCILGHLLPCEFLEVRVIWGSTPMLSYSSYEKQSLDVPWVNLQWDVLRLKRRCGPPESKLYWNFPGETARTICAPASKTQHFELVMSELQYHSVMCVLDTDPLKVHHDLCNISLWTSSLERKI